MHQGENCLSIAIGFVHVSYHCQTFYESNLVFSYINIVPYSRSVEREEINQAKDTENLLSFCEFF